jgi:hypothetical protein
MVHGFSHGCHGEPQLGCSHFVPVATLSTACPPESYLKTGVMSGLAWEPLRSAPKVRRHTSPGHRPGFCMPTRKLPQNGCDVWVGVGALKISTKGASLYQPRPSAWVPVIPIPRAEGPIDLLPSWRINSPHLPAFFVPAKAPAYFFVLALQGVLSSYWSQCLRSSVVSRLPTR